MALGTNVRFSRSAEIGAVLAACGYRWLMLDYEHGPVAPHIAQDVALGAIRAGVVPFARPSGHDGAQIAGLLTNGALGIIAPHVETAAQAAAVAHACRFAPEGGMSVPGTMPHFGYGVGLVEACARFNAEVTVIAMIESPVAVANVGAIAGVPGIDGVFIGASDFLWASGCPGAYGGPELAGAVAAVAGAARGVGKVCGMGGADG